QDSNGPADPRVTMVRPGVEEGDSRPHVHSRPTTGRTARMTDYNVIVEYPDTADHDDVLDALTGMSPVVATTTPGRAHVVLTIDADSIPSAVTLAAHHV